MSSWYTLNCSKLEATVSTTYLIPSKAHDCAMAISWTPPDIDFNSPHPGVNSYNMQPKYPMPSHKSWSFELFMLNWQTAFGLLVFTFSGSCVLWIAVEFLDWAGLIFHIWAWEWNLLWKILEQSSEVRVCMRSECSGVVTDTFTLFRWF